MLDSVEKVISELGGTSAAARVAGVDPRLVSNWKFRDRIPAKFSLVFSEALGCRINPRVFGVLVPEERE